MIFFFIHDNFKEDFHIPLLLAQLLLFSQYSQLVLCTADIYCAHFLSIQLCSQSGNNAYHHILTMLFIHLSHIHTYRQSTCYHKQIFMDRMVFFLILLIPCLFMILTTLLSIQMLSLVKVLTSKNKYMEAHTTKRKLKGLLLIQKIKICT